MKDLEKMLMKKKDSGKLSEEAIKAKMEVLMELLEMATSAEGSNVKAGMDEMQKVSVMAPDKEALLEGLDKAEDVIEESPEMEEESTEPSLPMDSDDEESEENMFSKREPKEKSKKPLFMMDEDEE